MSIIITQITGRGIVHVADSNLTKNGNQKAGEAKKLFELPRHKAAITVAGTYGVAGQRMDAWLDAFIANDSTMTLKAFTESLASVVNATNPDFSKVGYFFHIAGYQQTNGVAHPEFYHITNFTIATDGSYQATRSKLEVSEDFWSAHGQRSEEDRFGNHKGYVYCNGFPSGRQAYFAMLDMMAKYRSSVWSNSAWQFQPPTSVAEEAKYLENDMAHIGILFSHSKYDAPFIGGKVQMHSISSP